MALRSKVALAASAAAAILAPLMAPSAALAWTRTYQVEWIEPAFYYGGSSGAEESPGPDCPNGVNPDVNWRKYLTTSYRTKADVEALLDPEFRSGEGRFYMHLGFRGPDQANIYDSPTGAGDPGFVEMSGKVAYGFDLDGNPATGFTSPEGVAGVDNAWYKVGGCISPFRGPARKAYFFKGSMERMRAGQRTLVVVMSGDKDPMNDDDVKVGIYSSPDRIMKDANGDSTPDISFRINPKHQSIFKATIKDGLLEAVDRPTIHLNWAVRGQTGAVTDLAKSKVRLVANKDGTMQGLIGGYRDWFKHYVEMAADGRTTGAAIHENIGHLTLPGLYHSMRRNADGLPDPITGANMGMSMVVDVRLIPAFVWTPDNTKPVVVAQNY